LIEPERVYILNPSFEHLGHEEYDATLVPFEGSDDVAGWIHTRQIQTPEPIYFLANFDTLERTEYPVTTGAWPIFSSRMVSILERVGEFPHRRVPVRFVDRRAVPPGSHPAEVALPAEARIDDYVLIQLLEHLDAFDWEKSEYETDPWGVDEIRLATRVVLKEPAGGFPPLFRLSAKSTYPLVSQAAREALEAEGVVGLHFAALTETGTF
jgi:hypothetical protein